MPVMLLFHLLSLPSIALSVYKAIKRWMKKLTSGMSEKHGLHSFIDAFMDMKRSQAARTVVGKSEQQQGSTYQDGADRASCVTTSALRNGTRSTRLRLWR